MSICNNSWILPSSWMHEDEIDFNIIRFEWHHCAFYNRILELNLCTDLPNIFSLFIIYDKNNIREHIILILAISRE